MSRAPPSGQDDPKRLQIGGGLEQQRLRREHVLIGKSGEEPIAPPFGNAQHGETDAALNRELT